MTSATRDWMSRHSSAPGTCGNTDGGAEGSGGGRYRQRVPEPVDRLNRGLASPAADD